MKRSTAILCGLAWAALLGGPALAQGQGQTGGAAKAPLYNTMKTKLLAHKQVFAFTVNKLDVANYCEYAKHYDYAFFDMQHTTMSFADVEQMIAACPHNGAMPFVRLPDAQEWHIQHATDVGALGVIIPTVDDVDRAREAVKWARYPPVARRSLGNNQASRIWGPDYRNTINDNILLVIMIETPTGVANAYDIAAVPGVDGIFVGNNDLASFSGFPMDSPEYMQLLNRIHDATVKTGKFFGCAYSEFAKGYPLSKDILMFQNGPSNDGWVPPAQPTSASISAAIPPMNNARR
jgi:4-hydroxy-2-oxoheptanedioate aldolase